MIINRSIWWVETQLKHIQKIHSGSHFSNFLSFIMVSELLFRLFCKQYFSKKFTKLWRWSVFQAAVINLLNFWHGRGGCASTSELSIVDLQGIQPVYSLNGENYLKWSQLVCTMLKGKGKNSYLELCWNKGGRPKFCSMGWRRFNNYCLPVEFTKY